MEREIQIETLTTPIDLTLLAKAFVDQYLKDPEGDQKLYEKGALCLTPTKQTKNPQPTAGAAID